MSGSTSNTYNTSGDSPQGMTTGEMLELAAVDALGLLDDAEREAFDAAFRRAPSAVRELVRAEQARVAAEKLRLELSNHRSMLQSYHADLMLELQELIAEGGQPARLARYEANAATLNEGMAAMGFEPFLEPDLQGCIINTSHTS